MKTRLLFAALLCCALPAWAQPDPVAKPVNGLPFPLVTPAEVEKTATLAPLKLHLVNITVASALEQLQDQSGVDLNMENEQYSKQTLAKKISVDVETPSFNRAFDAIMEAAKLKPNLRRDDPNESWRVDFNRYGRPNKTTVAPQSQQGLFGMRLSRLNTTLSKNVDLRDPKAPSRSEQNTLNVAFRLLPDVRLSLVGAARARFTRAEDDQGRSLLPPKNDNQERVNVYGFYNNNYQQTQGEFNLRAPDADAKTISHLEGVVVYALITGTEKWEVPDLMSQTEWTRTFKSGDQSFDVTIKPTLVPKNKNEEDGEAGSLKVAVTVVSNQRPGQNEIPPPLLASGPILAGLEIVDAGGIKLRRNGYGGGDNGNDGKITVNASFYPGGNYGYDENGKRKPLALPLQLFFTAPLSVVQTEAPFSFENVALP